MSTTKPEIHNPDNLTPEQYGASEGWRLLYVGELQPHDSQFFSPFRIWRYGSDGHHQCSYLTYRTRTPDPYADKPADGWIRMSERKPTEADLPVWAYYSDDGTLTHWNRIYATDGCGCATHWRHAKADTPAPPPREPTQAERDEAVFDAFNKSGDGFSWSSEAHGYTTALRTTWLKALAYERAEIAKLLPGQSCTIDEACATIAAIRVRVNGGKS
jgi:hypothetical protein